MRPGRLPLCSGPGLRGRARPILSEELSAPSRNVPHEIECLGPRLAASSEPRIWPRMHGSCVLASHAPRRTLSRTTSRQGALVLRHDVVVVGAGLAGMRAAIEAKRAGADV